MNESNQLKSQLLKRMFVVDERLYTFKLCSSIHQIVKYTQERRNDSVYTGLIVNFQADGSLRGYLCDADRSVMPRGSVATFECDSNAEDSNRLDGASKIHRHRVINLYGGYPRCWCCRCHLAQASHFFAPRRPEERVSSGNLWKKSSIKKSKLLHKNSYRFIHLNKSSLQQNDSSAT